MTKKNPNAVRCAIYTRKSSEEGLEQEFNSLDAQREACEAYIQSQKHEGWSALPEHYDDGGFSGGNMGRPALERILEGIRAGKIDTVVVYKIDRLTRSLADFAKMVEIFDEREVMFVSVTQQFNTTTSMGRLTLNVLLSFAQFEREVTGERIRDKIAASKKKGMWMGGNLPMGYDVEERELLVNEMDAKTVQHIYHRYLKLGSVSMLGEELKLDLITSPIRVAVSSGRQSGGRPLARGALYKMLSNRIYLGEVTHKDKFYPGLHKAIIDPALFDAVQAKLTDNRVKKANGFTCKQPSLLAGLMPDTDSNRMTPSHANKNGRRYRYYVSRSLTIGKRDANPTGLRIPAQKIEQLVSMRLLELLTNQGELADAVKTLLDDTAKLKLAIVRGNSIARNWWSMAPSQKRTIFLALIRRIDLSDKTTAISLSPQQLIKLLMEGPDDCLPASKTSEKEEPLIMRVDFDLKQCGLGIRMLVDGRPAGNRAEPNKRLIRLIATAHRMFEKLADGKGLKIKEITEQESYTDSYATCIMRLAFLSPDITAAILNGTQTPDITPDTLMRDTRLPLDRNDHAEFIKAE